MRFKGGGASSGKVLGRAVVFIHRPEADPSGKGTGFLGVEEELACFRGAVKDVYDKLLELAKESEKKFGSGKAGIFEGYAEILTDGEIEEAARALIAGGLNAARAGQKVMEDLAEEWERMEPYMAQRAGELRDLGRKLYLSASDGKEKELPVLTEASILVADELSPFETVALNHHFLKGLAMDSGGYTGHVAILARSLGIPCVIGLGGASASVKNGELCALDGDEGLFILNPHGDEIEIFSRQGGKTLCTPHPEAVCTRDGVSIAVCANIGSHAEAALAKEWGADGVGLLRTEFLYMNMKQLPGEDEQYEAYRQIIKALDGKPLTIRTMDIGGDKEFPALGLAREENPFLGYRAVRIGLDQPAVFKTQLRAILRASALGKTELMFPMIVSPDEFRAAKALLEECRRELEHEGHAAGNLPVGVMVETPAAALMAREIAKEADFFSLGTNDLTQYTLAVDRGNPKVASLYDPLHPAVLRLVAMSAEAADEAGISIGICGELAGGEDALPLLVGLGLVKLSLSGPKIPLIKERIKQLDRAAGRVLAGKALSCESAAEVHELLQREA